MPNWCNFEMSVAGRYDCVDRFLTIICNTDNASNESTDIRFARVHDIHVDRFHTNYMYKKIHLTGCCAWSVYSCMFSGKYTYYGDYMKGNNNGNLGPLTNIVDVSRDLQLDIEILSKEPGLCFCEYFRITCGEILENREGSYREIGPEWFDTYKEFCDTFYPNNPNPPISEERFITMREKCEWEEECEYEFTDIIPEDRFSQLRQMCHIVK